MNTSLDLDFPCRNLVAIDAGVEDYMMLVHSVADDATVIVLQRDRNGMEQLTQALQAHPHITHLHIVAHGAPGCLYLGNTELSLMTLDHYALYLLTWFFYTPHALGDAPSVHLYGCNVAAGDAGAEFLKRLHDLTGAKIAASTTPIGSTLKGGNWDLDVTLPTAPHCPIAPPPFDPATLAAYSGVLTAGDPDSTFGTNVAPSERRSVILVVQPLPMPPLCNPMAKFWSPGEPVQSPIPQTLRSPATTPMAPSIAPLPQGAFLP